MKCPFCEAQKKISKVHAEGNQYSTLLAYSPGHYDENGRWVKTRILTTIITLMRVLMVIGTQSRVKKVSLITFL